MPELWPGRPVAVGRDLGRPGRQLCALLGERRGGRALFLRPRRGRARQSRVCGLTQRTRNTWHAYVPGCAPSQLYGYRVYGRFDPWAGLRINPAKLLVDPYARALHGAGGVGRGAPRSGTRSASRRDLARDDSDSAAAVPKSIVIDSRFNLGDDRPPNVPLQRSVIYELHVKGFTAKFPGLEPKKRGTYAGLAARARRGFI